MTDEEETSFASLSLYQYDRFDHELGKLKAGVLLSQLFGGPVYAMLRRMVQRFARQCALLMVEKVTLALFSSEEPYCIRKNYLLSEPFATDFGRLSIPHELTADRLSIPKRWHDRICVLVFGI